MKDIVNGKELLNKIDLLRYTLEKNLNDNLIEDEIVKMSQSLDRLIVFYYKQGYKQV
ncbi:aspartyl-phosphate phosphatase Spo0E family protein [Wukongibacter baidiensis]|uniref:aspartyl-phosphate phosphatase Spo0E family protein n=1 Tax=Wukongibacter baidiensis TaxID=1723361 RepID=UPI003D7FCDEC